MASNLPSNGIWLYITMDNGDVFTAKSGPEDALTIVVTDVLGLSLNAEGNFALSVVSKMRYINRNKVMYRDVIDELIDLDAQYEDANDVPWYFKDREGMLF